MALSKKKTGLLIILIIVLIAIIFGWLKFRDLYKVPTWRLKAGTYYPQMPPDDHHYYLELPIDHNNPACGSFMSFYILSPNFKKGDPVIFQLYDNQQEKVGLITKKQDFEIFDELVGKDASYVLIGNRGVSPTLFPELYNEKGKPNIAAAIRLYSSEQQIDDIEAVRKDMAKRNLLPDDEKIMLTGGSGGGFLVQQYLNKYGEHVARAIIESSSAPDLCSNNKISFARSFYSSNSKACALYYNLYKENKTNATLAWMLMRIGIDGDTSLQNEILTKESGIINFPKFKERFNISRNAALIKFIFSLPGEIELKVRIWELIGYDLINYNPKSETEVNLMYESMKVFLKDFMEAYKAGEISPTSFNINRSLFKGEVMVWSNIGDQDFGYYRPMLIRNAYPNSMLLCFNEQAHRLTLRTRYYTTLSDIFFKYGIHSYQFQQYLKLTQACKKIVANPKEIN